MHYLSNLPYISYTYSSWCTSTTLFKQFFFSFFFNLFFPKCTCLKNEPLTSCITKRNEPKVRRVVKMKELFFTLDCKNTLNVLCNISSTYVTNTSCVCRHLFFHFVDKWFLQWRRRSKWKIDYFDYNELLCCACKINKTQMFGDTIVLSTYPNFWQ